MERAPMSASPTRRLEYRRTREVGHTMARRSDWGVPTCPQSVPATCSCSRLLLFFMHVVARHARSMPQSPWVSVHSTRLQDASAHAPTEAACATSTACIEHTAAHVIIAH